MTPFHVGMRVVCVDDSGFREETGIVRPKRFGVYTVRGFEDSPEFGLRLAEIINPPRLYFGGFAEKAFKVSRFRPAHENRMDELRTLLAPIPSKTKQLVQS